MALGPKWGKNGPKMAKKRKNDPEFHFFAIFGPFFPHFGPRAIFYFFGQFFPIFGFRPVFHSIPGGLTRNPRTRKTRSRRKIGQQQVFRKFGGASRRPAASQRKRSAQQGEIVIFNSHPADNSLTSDSALTIARFRPCWRVLKMLCRCGTSN